jgi:hypothetical protein
VCLPADGKVLSATPTGVFAAGLWETHRAPPPTDLLTLCQRLLI